MNVPEDAQTDIIPALRADGDTAVDVFGPVGARHRRSSRTPAWAKPAAGVTVILVAAAVTMYGTYTLRPGPAPRSDGPAPTVVLSEEPTTTGPAVPVVSPVARPSRTRADRRRTRTPSPSVSSSSAVPRRTVAPSPSPSPAPLVTRPASPSASPTGSPPPVDEEPTSPTPTPEVPE